MKYRGFKIEKSGEVYIVRKSTGEKAWAEPAINRATAKRWIDAHLAECAARNYTPAKPKRETLKQAGYTYVRALGDGEHLLRDEDGKFEVWFVNDGHASYGLRWNGHDLEFARSAAIPNYGGAR